MPQIKKTKIELKTQRDALKRFERFLPMLQLKKQQLQAEMQAVQLAMEKNRTAGESLLAAARPWLGLLAEDPARVRGLVTDGAATVSEANIAGVVIPVFESVSFKMAEIDLYDSPVWAEDARDLIARLAEIRLRQATLERQHALLAEELRTTSQRVNLFEKVKIPETREVIRVIKIFLGDQMTAEVARGKAAKKLGGRRAAE